MKKNKIVLYSVVGVIILISILSTVPKLFFSNTKLQVKKNDASIEISLLEKYGDNFSTNIDMKNIEDIDYLKGYILYNSYGKYSNRFDLYNGDKNVQVYSMNDKVSGVFIKTATESYLISGNTKSETLELYNELQENKNFEVEYKKQNDIGVSG